MSHRTLLIGLLAFGTTVCTAQTPPEPSPEVKALLETMNVFQRPNFENYHAMTEEARGLLIAHFREQRRIAEGTQGPGSPDLGTVRSNIREAKIALTLLKDPEMTESLLRTFCEVPISHLDGETNRLLGFVADPKALQRLAPEMQKDEPLEYIAQGDSRVYVPKPYGAAGLMLRIVANSPAFEDDTRKWAKANEGLVPDELLVVARQWWKENEGLIKAGDYKSVKPGEQRMAVRAEEGRKKEAFYAARNEKAAAERAAREAAASAPAVTPAVAAAGWGALGYGLVGLLVLLLVAGVMIYSRRTHHA
jgi:hypothetical protein